jgi:hypothetical protein
MRTSTISTPSGPCSTSLFRLAVLLLAGCGGASSDPGLSAGLFVADAQFASGRMPASASGPAIVSIAPPHAQVQAGGRAARLSGILEASATAVMLGLAGDEGYWIASAGAPTLAEPDLPTFDLWLNFSRYREGPVSLRLRAVDASGRAGPERTLDFEASAIRARGELVVTLRWDSEADLDLHVLDPLGEEVWAGNINSFKRPPVGSAPVDRHAWMNGGILDLDSNAGCVSDSRREENVVWANPPPSGTYEVRVAAASLCGEDVAHWTVEVFLNERRVSATSGIAVGTDTRHGAGRGAGVQAASFTAP